MLRRNLLRTTALAVPAAILGACTSTGTTAATIAQTVVTDAADVANGLATFAADAVSLPNAAAIEGYAKDAVTIANTLVTSMTQTVAQPIISQIASDVTAVSAAVAGNISLSTTAQGILNDVVLALNILLPLVGLLAPSTSTTSAASGDAASAIGYLHTLPTVTVGGVATTGR